MCCPLYYFLIMILKTRQHPQFEGQIVGRKTVFPMERDLEAQQAVCARSHSWEALSGQQMWVLAVVLGLLVVTSYILYATGNTAALVALWRLVGCRVFGVGCESDAKRTELLSTSNRQTFFLL